MVCSFGLGDEATALLASTGARTLRGLRDHTPESLSAAFLGVWHGGGSLHKGTGITSIFGAEPAVRDPIVAPIAHPAPAAPPAHAAGTAKALPEPDPEAVPDGAEKDETASTGGLSGLSNFFGFGCFPACASVYVKGRGPVAVGELQPGDRLLSGDVRTGLMFSPFLGYLHSEPSSCAEYVALRTLSSNAVLQLSGEHLVFARRGLVAGKSAGEIGAVPARELQVGDWLSRVGIDGDLSWAQISAVDRGFQEGVFAPLTECGTLVVNGTLCSCYVDTFPEQMPGWIRQVAASHEASHGALLPLRVACRLGLVADMETKAVEGVHPYCRALAAIPRLAQALV